MNALHDDTAVETRDVVAALQYLGQLLVQCREIPSPVLDEHCKDISTKPIDFEIRPAPDFDDSEAAGDYSSFYKRYDNNKIVTKPENYNLEMICLFHDEHPYIAYWYYRRQYGCVGEGIRVARCTSISKLSQFLDGSCVQWEILEIGRNDHYNPFIPPVEEGIAVVTGESPIKMKIVPTVPLEDHGEEITMFNVPIDDVLELTRRFSTLIDLCSISQEQREFIAETIEREQVIEIDNLAIKLQDRFTMDADRAKQIISTIIKNPGTTKIREDFGFLFLGE